MITQSLFVVACLAIYVRAQQPCLHAPQNPHSFAASPRSCAHYIICMGGNVIDNPEQQCGPGHNFDPPTQTCGQTSCMECSPFGIQNLPHPDDCYQYIECILGHRRIVTCPNGLMFDRTVGQCNEPHLVQCPYDPFPTDPWPTDPWPTDPWPTDPWPTDPWPTDPWPTDPPGGAEPVCRGQVFHAHPTDCTRFFMCLDEVLWTHQCPSDLHWNQLINACDFPEYARCLSGGGGGTTTTDPPLFPPDPEYPIYPTDPPLDPPEDEYQPWSLPALLPPRK
ncbi:probable chitinase 10 isoform X1 [Bradysia coprophila]|uniref:probable chitinase 10 isoform X1 n=1 Tax=Bradysia coprophila TaxID=38358 RepID=UPI00187DA2BB|nr:probable chitinase 10 isoform X1 [Bradysia coprophila]